MVSERAQSLRKIPRSQQGPKIPEKGSETRFLNFFPKYNPCVPFLLEYEGTNGRHTFSKNHISGKNFVLELW